jgi:hypothetical protein
MVGIVTSLLVGLLQNHGLIPLALDLSVLLKNPYWLFATIGFLFDGWWQLTCSVKLMAAI